MSYAVRPTLCVLFGRRTGARIQTASRPSIDMHTPLPTKHVSLRVKGDIGHVALRAETLLALSRALAVLIVCPSARACVRACGCVCGVGRLWVSNVGVGQCRVLANHPPRAHTGRPQTQQPAHTPRNTQHTHTPLPYEGVQDVGLAPEVLGQPHQLLAGSGRPVLGIVDVLV